MERMVSDMETQKIVDSEQLRRLNTVDKVLEVKLVEIPRLHGFPPLLPLGN